MALKDPAQNLPLFLASPFLRIASLPSMALHPKHVGELMLLKGPVTGFCIDGQQVLIWLLGECLSSSPTDSLISSH